MNKLQYWQTLTTPFSWLLGFTNLYEALYKDERPIDSCITTAF
ncbi:hypothetical protein [Prevotella veroralis]|uniref:Uncharacterized protein n=1 Tax=Prevotella veroralis F0319 TaxID=649761 RepID=C9MMW2_9BACT|nr:hypothetical protein [Prevotella veroralis]EEX19162.1 hypothetical protein HMPREF0973_00947 [Prevotella veroralis F0319]